MKTTIQNLLIATVVWLLRAPDILRTGIVSATSQAPIPA